MTRMNRLGAALAVLAATAIPTLAAAPLSPAAYLERKLEADRRWAAGEHEAAVPLMEALAAENPDDGDLKMRLAWGLLETGRAPEARPLLVECLDSGFANEALVSLILARGCARRGEVPQSLALLERALAARLEDRPDLQTDEYFASLRDDARFRRLAGFAPAGELSREEGWRFDLEFFAEEARRLHAAPDRRAFSPELDADLDALAARVGQLDDAAVAMELQRIVVKHLADGHSVVYPIPTPRVDFGGVLPVMFYEFADGLFVVKADGHEDLVGRRVLAIGGRDVDSLRSALPALVSQDNGQTVRWIGPLYLTFVPTLRALGGRADGNGRFVLTVADGTGRREVALEPGPPTHLHEKLGAAPGGGKPPAWLARVGEAYWHEVRPELDAVYVQFNQVQDADGGPTIAEFANVVRDALRETRARNLILDVRHNNGGNNGLIWPLVRLVAWHETDDDSHRTFVITGRGTFSACQNFVNFLDRTTHAVFVGEPSASKPNFTGEDTSVQLPWSGIRLSISSRWWQDSVPGDRRPYIPVSMPVELTSADWRAGQDPVMEELGKVLAKR